MEPDQEQAAPEAADSETAGGPAQTVRVPNVSPNAKSGLDHTIIGSNALEGAGDPDDDPGMADPFDHPGDDSVPQGDVEAALRWVAESETSDVAKARADATWGAYAVGDDAETNPANAELATRLRSLVYGEPPTKDEGQDPPPAPVAADDPQPDGGKVDVTAGDAGPGDTLLGTVTVPEGLTGEDLDAWISGDAVEGDETENPERWAAYLERRQAAADLIDQHGDDESGSGSGD